jgi:hypothetical protein
MRLCSRIRIDPADLEQWMVRQRVPSVGERSMPEEEVTKRGTKRRRRSYATSTNKWPRSASDSERL